MTQGRWSQFAGSSEGGKWVNKEQWAEEGVVFTVIAITKRGAEIRNGKKYDAQWVLRVVDDRDETYQMSFGAGSGGRDDAFEDAQKSLQSGELGSIGPVTLRQVTTNSGRPFYVLEDTDQPGTSAGTREERVALAEASGLDDLPF